MSLAILVDSVPYLDQIKQLWRSNARTLGFFPDGGFSECASYKQILVALSGSQVLGYLLFRISRDRVVIVHLCVEKSHRQQHMARRLVEYLAEISKGYRGIAAACRRDFEANKIWPRLGFAAIAEKPGRGRGRATLTYWWLDHGNPDLFSGLDVLRSPERLSVALDANVFYDIYNKDAPDTLESKSLVADWLAPYIELKLTRETLNEIDRNVDPIERSQNRRLARAHPVVICESHGFRNLRDELRVLFPSRLSKSDESDIRQLAWAIGSGTRFFVTRDTNLLNLERQVYERYGVSVIRPSDLVIHLDELRESSEYQPARVAGALIWSRMRRAPDGSFAELFQCSSKGETKRKFRERLCRFLADPEKFKCFQLHNSEGIPLACLVYDKSKEGELHIPVFRVRDIQLGLTIQRNLLLRLMSAAAADQRVVVRITDPYCEQVCSALSEENFTKMDNDWVKLSLPEQLSAEDLVLRLNAISRGHQLQFNPLAELVEHLKVDTRAALRIERLLWPLKIIDASIPTFIVPIRPHWAKELFDENLASEDLFGASTTLALNREGVYYRAAVPSCGLSAPARILWYVSEDRKYYGSKSIRACSYLDDVVIGAADDVFRRFRRLGIYRWEDVLKIAKGKVKGTVMALHFMDTELLTQPLRWDKLQQILNEHGLKSRLQSPCRISPPAFHAIYSKATGQPRVVS